MTILVTLMGDETNDVYYQYLSGVNFSNQGFNECGDPIYLGVSPEIRVSDSGLNFFRSTIPQLQEGRLSFAQDSDMQLVVLVNYQSFGESDFESQLSLLEKLYQDVRRAHNLLITRGLVLAFVGVPPNRTLEQVRNKAQRYFEKFLSHYDVLSYIKSSIFLINVEDGGSSRRGIVEHLSKKQRLSAGLLCSPAVEFGQQLDNTLQQINRNISTFVSPSCFMVVSAGLMMLAYLRDSDWSRGDGYIKLFALCFVVTASYVLYEQGKEHVVPQITMVSDFFRKKYTRIEQGIELREEQVGMMLQSMIRILQAAEETPLEINTAIRQGTQILETVDQYAAQVGIQTAELLKGTRNNLQGLVTGIRNTLQVADNEIRRNGRASAGLTTQLSSEIRQFREASAQFLSQTSHQHGQFLSQTAQQHGQYLDQAAQMQARLGRDLGDAAGSGQFKPEATLCTIL